MKNGVTYVENFFSKLEEMLDFYRCIMMNSKGNKWNKDCGKKVPSGVLNKARPSAGYPKTGVSKYFSQKATSNIWHDVQGQKNQ